MHQFTHSLIYFHDLYYPLLSPCDVSVKCTKLDKTWLLLVQQLSVKEGSGGGAPLAEDKLLWA